MPQEESFLPALCVLLMAVLRLDEQKLPAYFEKLGLVRHAQSVEVQPAGDGNINWVRRVVSNESGSSWIVKQARPTLEAFPQFSASTRRIDFEVRYFERVSRFDDDGVCPRVEYFDSESSVLVLEDLSDCDRMDHQLSSRRDISSSAATIGRFLGRVHDGTVNLPDLADAFQNDEMRRLHGDHIFFLPYRDNDFPLSPAIAPIAKAIRNNAKLVSTIDEAFRRYLDPRGALIHADVQPTNILIGSDGSKVTPKLKMKLRTKLLDAEIAHVGDPAFDIGVLVAHLHLASIAHATECDVAALWKEYANAFTNSKPPLFQDVARYAGIEMLRRTLGAARAPGVDRDECASQVLAFGTRLIESPPELPV